MTYVCRKFWRYELVRLKYHNPAIPMTIDRTNTSPDSDAIMSIHFTAPNATQTSDSATSSPAPLTSTSTSTDSADTPDYAATERVEEIPMKNRTNSEILQDLVRVTKAYPVEPTEAERQEMRALEEQTIQSERASALSLEVRQRVKREKELLEQAKGDLAAQNAYAS